MTGREVFGYLRDLHRDEGTTVVVVTHDPEYLAAGDRRLRIRDGLVDGDEVVSEDEVASGHAASPTAAHIEGSR
ncbi:MAG: hypothetical protein AAFZ07_30110, partial [Actinomycetota bacterium]